MRNPTLPANAGKTAARLATLVALTLAVVTASFRPEVLALPFLIAMVAMPVALGFAFADAETQGAPGVAVMFAMLFVTEAFCGFFAWHFASGIRSAAFQLLPFAH